MSRRVVSIHYTLTNSSGEELDSSNGQEPLTYMEGVGQIIPGLEKEIALLQKGDKKRISVPASEAYGERDERKIIKVPREKMPKQDIKIGDRFAGGREPHSPVFVVKETTLTEITLDANHPLAGVDLTFEVELVAVRPATEEEAAHGHAHGEHGHSH